MGTGQLAGFGEGTGGTGADNEDWTVNSALQPDCQGLTVCWGAWAQPLPVETHQRCGNPSEVWKPIRGVETTARLC